MGTITLVTWNAQGSQGLDVAAAADRLRGLARDELDVVALQEVQRHQARALAEALGMATHRWAFKHWPVTTRAEGLAILTRHRLEATRPVCVRRAAPWSWRRRVVLLARVATPAGRVVLADVHLSPHRLTHLRAVQASRVDVALGAFGRHEPSFVLGDLNDVPGSVTHAVLTSGGGRVDAWAAVNADADATSGATSWTVGSRAGRLPTQRLDHVLVPPPWRVQRAVVPRTEADQWAVLSDHLPVCVTCTLDAS